MTITIFPESVREDRVTYRAISGAHQSEGKTVGEALDALTKQLAQEETGTLVIVQSLRPDRFFTAQQQQRLGELMTRWRSARDLSNELPDDEEAELEELVEAELKAATSRALAMSQELKQKQQAAPEAEPEEATPERPFDRIIGDSVALKEVLKLSEQIAQCNGPVLLMGESGAGKDLLAHAIHSASPRADQPFIKVDIARLPANWLEGELFGRQRGAFTNANAQQTSLFVRAHRGTLMLDNIDLLAPDAQAKVLRVLEWRRIDGPGGSNSLAIDVRVIATANRDLHAEVEAGRFREDLYRRLSFLLTIPPLRQRREDIPLLVRHFVQQIGARLGKQFDEYPESIMSELQKYDWPGNIRELENWIERAVVLSEGRTLMPSDVPPLVGAAGGLLSGVTLEQMEWLDILVLFDDVLEESELLELRKRLEAKGSRKRGEGVIESPADSKVADDKA